MKLTELNDLLELTGYPVTYSHFNDSPPTIPFICYRFIDSDNFFADNVVFLEGANIDIELYTVKKDLIAEQKIKDLLMMNDIPYEQNEVYINSEKLFKNTFEVELR